MDFSLRPAFELLDVCWPQPVRQSDRQWVSEPAWNAPSMDTRPRWKLRLIDGCIYWSLDWRDFFRTGVRTWNAFDSGEMRGFHVVFRLRVERSGTLVFQDDDGSVIRIGGCVVHDDRSAHPLTSHEVQVSAGDILEVAQWQLGWDWLWCARMSTVEDDALTPESVLLRWLPAVEDALRRPDGPPLKMYTSASHPLRAAASLYSMILNGYSPASVHLFGEDQWSASSRDCLARLLPFAQVVPQGEALQHVRALGGAGLADIARRHWFAAKAFAALASPPAECCLMDDDLFILDPPADALDAFRRCDLVYAPDQDLTDGYLRMWQRYIPLRGPLRTGRFNAGLYWIRNQPPGRAIASAALRCRPDPPLAFLWEQGLVAMLYAERATCELPSQGYSFVCFDGLPGGAEGYDYSGNPCGYTAIHFGGLAEKPSDALALQIFTSLAGRHARMAAWQNPENALAASAAG